MLRLQRTSETPRSQWAGSTVSEGNLRDPVGDELGGVLGLGVVGEEVVGFGEGEEGFRVFGGGVDLAGVFDTHYAVSGGVDDKEVAVEIGNCGLFGRGR